MLFILVFSAVFGSENQLIGVALTTGILMFKEIGVGFPKYQAPVIILLLCILMSISNLICAFNVYAAVAVNFITIVAIMFFTTEEISNKTYIPFILMYIFAQGTKMLQGFEWRRFLAFLISDLLMAAVYAVQSAQRHRTHRNMAAISQKNSYT